MKKGDIMEYVERKISKTQRKIILPPLPEEVLNQSFDYQEYVKKAINRNYTQDEIEELFENLKPSQIEDDIEKLYQEYEKQIINIQLIYENDYKNNQKTIDYNKKMKEIAKNYLQKLNELIKSNSEKEKLNKKRKELIDTLKKALDQKRKIEKHSKERLEDFEKEPSKIKNLYMYDLSHLSKATLSKENKTLLLQIRQYINAQGIGVYYKTLDEIIKGKNK